MAPWFYEQAGQPAGPVSEDALRTLVQQRHVAAHTRVWRDGLDGWTPLAEALPHVLAPAAAAVPAPDASASWFYEANGQPAGPVTEASLREWLRAGQMMPGTRVWRDGMAGWEPVQTALPHALAPAEPSGAPHASDVPDANATVAVPRHLGSAPDPAAPPDSAVTGAEARSSDMVEERLPDASTSDTPTSEAPYPVSPTFDAALNVPAYQPFVPGGTVESDGAAASEGASDPVIDEQLSAFPNARPDRDAAPPDASPAPVAQATVSQSVSPSQAAAPVEAAATWYYEQDDEPVGPVTETALRQMLDRGTLGPSTRVWDEGMPDWVRASLALPPRTAPTSAPAAAPPQSFAPAPQSVAPPPTAAQPVTSQPATSPPAAPVAAVETAWHYEQNGVPAGPLPESQIADLVARGAVQPGTRVWRTGMTDWASASAALPALFGAAPMQSALAAPTPVVHNVVVQNHVTVPAAPVFPYDPAALYAGQMPYAKPGFFSIDGRLNRGAYFKRIILFALLSIVTIPIGIGIVMSLFSFFFLLPTYVQRAHDLDKPGTWLLWGLVPIVNFFIGLMLLFSRGTPGPNRYGADPLSAGMPVGYVPPS